MISWRISRFSKRFETPHYESFVLPYWFQYSYALRRGNFRFRKQAMPFGRDNFTVKFVVCRWEKNTKQQEMTVGGEFTGGESSWWRGDHKPHTKAQCPLIGCFLATVMGTFQCPLFWSLLKWTTIMTENLVISMAHTDTLYLLKLVWLVSAMWTYYLQQESTLVQLCK